jgi:hypothetical protein
MIVLYLMGLLRTSNEVNYFAKYSTPSQLLPSLRFVLSLTSSMRAGPHTSYVTCVSFSFLITEMYQPTHSLYIIIYSCFINETFRMHILFIW